MEQASRKNLKKHAVHPQLILGTIYEVCIESQADQLFPFLRALHQLHSATQPAHQASAIRTSTQRREPPPGQRSQPLNVDLLMQFSIVLIRRTATVASPWFVFVLLRSVFQSWFGFSLVPHLDPQLFLRIDLLVVDLFENLFSDHLECEAHILSSFC